MTHASMDETARATAGITNSLLRLSVGIEDADDLVADLAAALDVALQSDANTEVALALSSRTTAIS